MRAAALFPLLACAAAACGEARPPDAPEGPPPPMRAVAGKAWFFDYGEPGRLEERSAPGAEVFVLERPERKQLLAEDGLFRFDELPQGSEVTIGVRHADYQPTLTATLVLGAADVDDLTLQVVSRSIAVLVANAYGVQLDAPGICQMAGTVTRVPEGERRWGIYAPGEPDAVVQAAPAIEYDTGIIYFNASTIPDKALRATTTDGGFLVVQADPGTYEWTATKAGRAFDPLRLKCVPGYVANASPPFGLQARAAP